MIKYARNVIEEFRRAKHYKYILCLTLTPLVCVLKILPGLQKYVQEKYCEQ